ncbi:MAG: hypothetical protein AB9Q22_00690 [Candidatus Reddybacter sp.]
MKTKEIQNQIRSIASEMNWKLPKVAEVLFVALNEDDASINEQMAINIFYEKLKGQLKRETTSSDLLNKYLNIMTNHPVYIKSNVVVPKYIFSNSISDALRSEMEITSKNITLSIRGDDL